mgnify:CR=1 FL=1|tara:strand:+ start:2593 stop:3111 length:519 start_codon:yes stop_codon:yes gene_type:complete
MNRIVSVETEWYLLKTKIRQEKRAMENLKRQHIECYCPEVLVEKIFRGKKSKIIEILFPGYLFVNFKNPASSIHSVKNTRGVQSFVAFGGSPALVPSAVIQELKEKTKTQENLRISNVPKRGDKLKVTDGLFSGISVVFFQPNGEERAEVLLTMMNQQVKASIKYSNLVAAN